MAYEAVVLGCGSLLLTLVNILCIIMMASIVLHIKEVVPLNQANDAIQTFFHHDIKVARNYNRTIQENEHMSEKNLAIAKRDTNVCYTCMTDQYQKRASANKEGHPQSMCRIRTDSTYYPTTLTDMNNLQMYAKDFELDVFSEEDRELLALDSEERVLCLVKNLLDMYEEDPPTFVDFCRYQPYGAQISAGNEHLIFYEHLIALLPPKWYELFDRERRRRLDIVQTGRRRSNSFAVPTNPFTNHSRLNHSFNEQHQRSRLLRLVRKENESSHNSHRWSHFNGEAIESDETLQYNMKQASAR